MQFCPGARNDHSKSLLYLSHLQSFMWYENRVDSQAARVGRGSRSACDIPFSSNPFRGSFEHEALVMYTVQDVMVRVTVELLHT